MIYQSETITNISAALVNAQSQFPTVLKESNNPAFRGAKYADLASIMKAVSPVLFSNGLAITQHPGVYRGEDILITRLQHESGEFIQSYMHLNVPRHDRDGVAISVTPQAQGSAITYARRYALSAVLGIVTEEDDDGNTASETRNPTKQQQDLATPSQAGLIDKLLKEKEKTVSDLSKFLGREVSATKGLTKAEASKTIEALMARPVNNPAES